MDEENELTSRVARDDSRGYCLYATRNPWMCGEMIFIDAEYGGMKRTVGRRGKNSPPYVPVVPVCRVMDFSSTLLL